MSIYAAFMADSRRYGIRNQIGRDSVPRNSLFVKLLSWLSFHAV